MAKEAVQCPSCSGSGTASVAFKCNTCGGSGSVWIEKGKVVGQVKK